MRLLSSVLGFLLRKMGLLAALVLALFLVSLLIYFFNTTVRGTLADRDRLPQVAGEVAALDKDLDQLRSLKEAREHRDRKCGFRGKVVDLLVPGTPCQSAVEAVEKAENVLRAGTREPVPADDDGVEREINEKEEELADKTSEQTRLERAQESGAGWLINRWVESWKLLASIALLVLVLPVALRFVSYFLLMPIVSRTHKPIQLAAGSENTTAGLQAMAALRTLPIELGAGEVLSVRSEYLRPVQGTVRSRLLYQWRAPFISFAAGLYGLTQVTGDHGGTSTTLATPDDPDSYLMRIDFKDHPGVVMQPKHVVGVIGTPQLETRWRWGLQSFATWQVRYIMFAGTGSLIVQGSGDVVATNPKGRSTKMDQNLVMGFDSRLTVGVDRTEVFWSYLWGRSPLVDDTFTGNHPLFWQKSTADGPSNPIARAFSAVFSAFGKLFGF